MTLVPNRSGICAAVAVGLLLGPFARGAVAATVTVPGNYATIQAAIAAVPDGTTINVQAGTYSERLTVSNTSRSITVRAIGGAVIVNAAGKGGAAVTVQSATGQIVFEGLTFRNGAHAAGGGFRIVSASPSFFNCIFENNTGTTDGGGGALFTSNATFTGCIIRNNSAAHFGGGVYITAGSRPVFTNCAIVTNRSGTGGAGVGNNGAGGGVFSSNSSPTFRSSHVNGNTSMFASGGIHHQGGFGSPRSMLLMEDSEVADNVSTQFPGEPNPSEGGGIHVEDNATATLTRVRILRNRAGTGGGLNAYRGRYDIVDSVIDANQATVGFGGGIGTSANFATAQMPASIVNLTTSLVRFNTAPIGGGIAMVGYASEKATLSLNASVVSGNQSQSQGGGILANVTNLTVTNSLVINNAVTGGANPYGGGIVITTTSAATINTTTIAHNTAGQHGGGIFMDGNSAVNMNLSNVYDNTAGTRGGGLFVGAGSSGTIQNGIIADNSSLATPGQINEDSCTSVAYRNNTITPLSGTTLFSGCAPGGRATGTSSNVPRFAKFLAVPNAGTSVVLAWSVARATSVTIAGIGVWNSPNNSPTGTFDVTPTSSTTYSLTATATSGNGGNYAAVTVGFTVVLPPPPAPTHIVDGDFDGDRKADITVFRPWTGTWYRRGTSASATTTWGSVGDTPAVGDYDGDGKIDIAVFRPWAGAWYILNSSTGSGAVVNWGSTGDRAVPGDYDGDGKTDVAVFRASTGIWYVRGSTTSVTYSWGSSGDTAAAGDYDGDGKTDVAVFREWTGTWYILNSSTMSGATIAWGSNGDIPVPADYDGDGKTDIAVFRPSSGTWYIRGSSVSATYVFGSGTDTPVPGDYDGDGKTDIAVFRPSTGAWYLVYSSTMSGATITWGSNGDIPILKRP